MANRDVEIVVGAKDRASRILKNVGNAASDLGKTSKKASHAVEKSGDRMESAFTGLQAAFAPLLAIVAAVKAATAAFSFVGDAASAFDTQEEAVRGLTKALELNGEVSQDTIDRHRSFASELQNLTNVGDEVTLGLMRQASMMGVADDQLQNVTRAAIGMSEATGASLEDSLRKVNETMTSNTEAFGEFIPALRTATTEEEKLALVLATAEKGLAQKADRAMTAAGSAERLSNTWGDFQEVVGEALAPIRKLINEGLTALITVIQSSLIPAIQSFLPSGDGLVAMMEKVRNSVIRAATFIEVVVGNLPQIWQLAVDSTQLQIIRLVEEVKHAFTVVIPAYGNWFADNFTNMMRDAFNATVTVVSNAATNIQDIIEILWRNIKTGFAGGFQQVLSDIGDVAARNLLDGFEAQTKALPEIAARRLTETEQELRNRITTAASDIAGEYRQKVADRMANIGQQAGQELAKGLQLAVNQAGDSMKDKAEGLTNQLSQMQKRSQSLTTENVAAVESRLLTRGSTQNGPEQMARLLEQLIGVARDIKQNTKPDESLSDDTFRVEVVT